jgi:hypothetical protein
MFFKQNKENNSRVKKNPSNFSYPSCIRLKIITKTPYNWQKLFRPTDGWIPIKQ